MFQHTELRDLQKKVCYQQHNTVDLREFPYWTLRNTLQRCTQLCARIPIGTFYQPFNAITETEFCYLKKITDQLSLNELLLVPHLRVIDVVTLQKLSQCGFCLINVEGESVIHYHAEDYQTYLRRTVGGKRFREHFRLWRKSQDYSLRRFHIQDVITQPQLFKGWDNLFEQHERKYGNSISVYGANFLKEAARLSNQDDYAFYFRFDKGDSIIQVYLTRQTSETLYLIASAINHNMCIKGLNFYTAMMMEVLHEKDRLNLAMLHLGRGNRNKKLPYGVNTYFPHVHAIYTKNEGAFAELIQEEDKTICGI